MFSGLQCTVYPCVQVPPDKAVSEAGGVSPLYEQLTSLQPRQELMAEYLWPRPPHYHLLWPGRPLPSLPVTKEAAPAPGPGHDLSEMLARSSQEPFFGFFFNNNFGMPGSRERKTKKDDTISQFMDGPFFR